MARSLQGNDPLISPVNLMSFDLQGDFTLTSVVIMILEDEVVIFISAPSPPIRYAPYCGDACVHFGLIHGFFSVNSPIPSFRGRNPSHIQLKKGTPSSVPNHRKLRDVVCFRTIQECKN